MGFVWLFMLLPLAYAFFDFTTAIRGVSPARGQRAKSSMSGSREAKSIASLWLRRKTQRSGPLQASAKTMHSSIR